MLAKTVVKSHGKDDIGGKEQAVWGTKVMEVVDSEFLEVDTSDNYISVDSSENLRETHLVD